MQCSRFSKGASYRDAWKPRDDRECTSSALAKETETRRPLHAMLVLPNRVILTLQSKEEGPNHANVVAHVAQVVNVKEPATKAPRRNDSGQSGQRKNGFQNAGNPVKHFERIGRKAMVKKRRRG